MTGMSSAVALRRRGSALTRLDGTSLVLIAVSAVVALMAVLPVVYLVVRALGADVETLALLARPRTAELLASSLMLALGTATGALLIGLPLAWLTARTDLPGARVWTILTVAPLAIPSYVLAFAVIAAFGPRGALQGLLQPLGIGPIPSVYGTAGALAVMTFATYPYVLLGTRAALLRADPAVEEAARSLGDSPFAAFRRATLPVVAPAVGAGALLAALYALSDFGAPSILRFDSFARAIHVQYRSSFDRSGAALFALVLVAATFVVVWAEAWVRRRAAVPVPHGARRAAPRTPLGRWRWPAIGFCGAVVGLALVLPVGTIVFWLARGVGETELLETLAEATRDSLVAAGSAALVASMMALPVAVLLVRHPGRMMGVLERLLYSAYAIPGISLALAVVFFTLNVAPLLYQTLVVLVVAYALRFLPQAVGTVRASLMLVGRAVPEAARSLGESPLGVLRTITLPLLRPGLVAGAALVFLSTIKELPLTLLVAPTGFQTLATEVWGAASEGFFARAAAPAALLTIVSAASVGLLLRSGGSRP